MTLIIAGERSGVGKTTVTLALLASLCRRKMLVQSFKVGPDYIDPMFHQHVTGRACRNLDPVLTNEAYVQECFARHCQGVDYALIEGVMGLFDGVSLENSLDLDLASTAHIARLLDLPVLLVLDCSRLSGSVAAIAHGYRSFDPRINLAGLVLNRVGSDRHLQLLQNALEPLQIPILGVLHRQSNIELRDRHLGLVPAEELKELDTVINQLAELGDTCFDWSALLPLLKSTPRLSCTDAIALTTTNYEKHDTSYELQVTRSIRVAVARDRAFSFYYPDNLDLLQQLNAELIFWSPLTDPGLPENVCGMYFGGGFPEVFARQLADNTSARAAVKAAVASGMPTIAECGGLMYLCDAIVDFEGLSSPMVGVLPATAVMGKRLELGYRCCTAIQDSPLVKAGDVVWGHEFHRSHLSGMPTNPLFQTRGISDLTPTGLEGWRSHFSLHASYIHLHFGGRSQLPKRFLQHCANFCVSQ